MINLPIRRAMEEKIHKSYLSKLPSKGEHLIGPQGKETGFFK